MTDPAPGAARRTATVKEGGVSVMCEVFLDRDLRMIGRATWPDGYQATWRAQECCEPDEANEILEAWASYVIGQMVASRPQPQEAQSHGRDG